MQPNVQNSKYNIPQDVIDYVNWREKQDFWKEHKKRLEGKVRQYYNNKIEKIAKGEYTENKVKEFSSFTMTKKAFEKTNYISKRISKLAGKPLELYMFLINKLNNYNNGDRVIRDVYIGRKQQVTMSNCEFIGAGEILSCIDIQDNLDSKILGWAHSHGPHPPFHSLRDNENISNFVNYYGMKKNVELINGFDSSFKVDFAYSPSIVVNAKNHNPFTAMAIKYPQFSEGGVVYKTHINYNCMLNLVDDNEKTEFDKKLIDAQILDYVSYKGKKLIDRNSYENIRIKNQLLAPLFDLPSVVIKKNPYVKNKIMELIKKCKKSKG